MTWKKAADILIGGKMSLAVYTSNRSDIRVIVVETPGPIVSGKITFVTETHTNDGLPHTLEHMVFMGSRRYPHKGILDTIANRCFANGTNAHTNQDNTEYQLSTVGSSGFLKVLPVYLDHLLQPTLSETHYLTEVHHINGDGENGGVVYSEMQGRNSAMEHTVDIKRKELFYPSGSSYGVEPGGTLSAIRDLCSIERVRNFHKKFYHLGNMYITVCGKIDHQKLLDAIEQLEQRNLDSIPRDFATPFQAPIPPLSGFKMERIVCPSDDESIGIVQMSWLGPRGLDLMETRALMILFDYFTDTSVAPLRKDFVQIEDPFCTSVSIYLKEQRDCEIVATFDGVPMNKLDKISDRYFDKTVVDHSLPEAFDMDRISYILDKHIRDFHSTLENNPSLLIFGSVIAHQTFLHAEDPQYKMLEQYLNDGDRLRQFKAKPAEFWHELFRKWLANKKCVCVVAEPSKQMVEEYEKTEAERVKQQTIEIGGADGLQRCQKKLDDAIHENTRDRPSDEELADLIVQDLEKFNMIDVSTSTNLSQQPDEFFGKFPFPFTAVLHTVPSDFFEVCILIDTDGIPTETRHFMLLWFELMFQSPAIFEGRELSYEEVANLSTKELESKSVSVGISDVFERFMTLRLSTTADSVSNLAKWANIYLKGILFRPDRVLIAAQNLVNQVAENKRDNKLCHFLDACSTFSQDATAHFCNHLCLGTFHDDIVAAIQLDRGAEVVARLEKVRQSFLAAPMNVHFGGDPSRIHFDEDAAEHFLRQWAFLEQPIRSLLQCPASYGYSALNIGKSRAIVGVVDGAFLLQTALLDDDWNGPSAMPTLLLAQYLQQYNGPLYTAVRGAGLAYGVNLYVVPDRKELYFDLYRCSQLSKAYQQTRETIQRVLDSGQLDQTLLECAKRSLIYELITGQNTVKQTVVSAILATIRSVKIDFTQKLCTQVWDAKAEDVLKIGGRQIRRLLDPDRSFCSIEVGPSQRKELDHFPNIEITTFEKLQSIRLSL